MLEKNSARSTRLTQLLAFVFAVTACVALGACRDASTAQGIAGPSASQSSDGSQAAIADDDDSNDRTTYEQVEFLGNPLVSEVTIAKANHDRYNRTQPYNTAEFGSHSLAFINAFRSADPVVANTLGAVLYPDILQVYSANDPTTAGWLSWAFGGWGGRKLSDDVVDIGLSAIFGSLLTGTPSVYCVDPYQLCTDNVNANDKPFLSTFPYLAAPTM